MKTTAVWNWIVSALLLLSLGAPSSAQSTFGSLTGTVTDKTSAAVPGAKVVVTNEGTGVARHATAGTDGVYSVTDLLPGPYRLQVEAKGFSPLDRPGITVDANRVVNVDVQMTVGSSTTRVEVVASAPVINTETPTTSYTKTGDHLMEMPALVRQSNSNEGFAIYNPGVGVNQSGNFYANGVRQIDNYISNDGIVEMSDPDTIGGGPIAPDLDSVAEISYILSNAPAEFKSPVDFTTVTKSGTNQFHGSAYYDYNGTALNARNFFSSTVPARVYNDYSVHAGGPIKHNKTFFFADYEDSSNHLAALINANTPLVPWRTGDFSGLLPKTVLKDPTTGQPFPNNQIPTSRLNPVSLAAQSFFFPLPNFGSATTQSGNYRAQDPATQVFKVVDGRVDHNFSEHDVIFARATYRRYPITNVGNFLPPVGPYNQLRTDGTAVFSWTHTFSPSLLNEFRTGYARNRSILAPTLVGSDILNKIGLQGIPTTGIQDVPVFTITGIQSTNQSSYQINLGTNYQWTDNLSWTHGAHSFKFGFDAIYDQIGGFTLPNTVYGTFTFNGTYTGQAYADFLLGIPQSTGQTAPTPERYARGTMWSMYAQDQWKITSRLTASYGLRYELQGPYSDNLGRIYGYDPKNSALVVPDNGLSQVSPLFPTNIKVETATQAGYPNPALVKFQKDNFYPRIGLAYKLTADGKTAIRSGYGIFGNTIYGGLAYNSVGGPFAGSTTFFNSISPSGTPLLSFPNPFVSGGGTVTALQNVAGFNPNIRTPYTQQWNVTLERQFHSLGLSLAYIGAQSIGLLYGRNLNQPLASTTKFAGYLNPAFNTITWKENGGTESYNSLQVSAVKNLGQGLTFSTGWTWARDLTDVPDNDNIVVGFSTPNSYNLRADRGNNNFTPLQRYYGDVVYALPVGAKQPFLSTLPHWADAALGGWRVSSVVTLQTGLFYSPTFDGFDPSNTNSLGGRPDRIAGVSLIPPGGPNANGWFNAAAFKIPGCPDSNPICSNPVSPGRFGNSGLNILQGPPQKNADIALMKDFSVHERFKVQFQAVFANAFNHPSFARPCANLGGGECYADISSPATVGHITATDASYLKGSQASRNINFAVRIRF